MLNKQQHTWVSKNCVCQSSHLSPPLTSNIPASPYPIQKNSGRTLDISSCQNKKRIQTDITNLKQETVKM